MIIILLVNSEVSILQQSLMTNPEQQDYLENTKLWPFHIPTLHFISLHNVSIKTHANLYLNYLIQTNINMSYVFHFEYIYLYQLKSDTIHIVFIACSITFQLYCPI